MPCFSVFRRTPDASTPYSTSGLPCPESGRMAGSGLPRSLILSYRAIRPSRCAGVTGRRWNAAACRELPSRPESPRHRSLASVTAISVFRRGDARPPSPGVSFSAHEWREAPIRSMRVIAHDEHSNITVPVDVRFWLGSLLRMGSARLQPLAHAVVSPVGWNRQLVPLKFSKSSLARF